MIEGDSEVSRDRVEKIDPGLASSVDLSSHHKDERDKNEYDI